MRGENAQAGIEYLIIVSFITMAIISIIALAYFYSDSVKDRIRLNQVETFVERLIKTSESVYYSGEPSEATINLYLPQGVKSIEINSNYILIITQTSSGENKKLYASQVALNGAISPSEGVKKLHIKAELGSVSIS